MQHMMNTQSSHCIYYNHAFNSHKRSMIHKKSNKRYLCTRYLRNQNTQLSSTPRFDSQRGNTYFGLDYERRDFWKVIGFQGRTDRRFYSKGDNDKENKDEDKKDKGDKDKDMEEDEDESFGWARVGLGLAFVVATGIVMYSENLFFNRNVLNDLYELSDETQFSVPVLTLKYFRFKERYPKGLTPKDLAKEMKINDLEIAKKIFDVLDVDNNGIIDVHEFLTAISILLHNEEEKRRFQFELWDSEHTGYLSYDEIFEMVQIGHLLGNLNTHEHSPEETTEEAMKYAGYSKDDKIPFEDFAKVLKYAEDNIWEKSVYTPINLKKETGGSGYSGLRELFYGTCSGVTSILASHPLDTIRVRMQLYEGGLISSAKELIAKEGITSLYRGVLPPVYAAGVKTGSAFLSRELFESLLNHKKNGEKVALSTISLTGILTGVVVSPIITPVELLKIRAQGYNASGKVPPNYKIAKKIFKTEGIRGFFRGSLATTLRLVPGWGIYFVSYEAIKRALQPGAAKISVTGAKRTAQAEETSIPVALFAGGIAGILSWIVSLPQDYVKTQLQMDPNKYKGFLSKLKSHKQVFETVYPGRSKKKA
eukprot:TRINITY_DN1273_c0_g1_i4.p1 TRINITY_DN1273_c0_g1~~TRINITY_DN1273_c0_g1_i4.p1  ORF type:complete len:607 (-),score=120.72 TRINITY_DN1273_c0_g1_i4:554-2329(-)